MLRQKDKQSDIVFQAGENLINQATGELVLTKNSFKAISISGERPFESYIHEFCGLTNLSIRSLVFKVEHRDVSPSLIISSSCLVRVTHSKDANASELSKALILLFNESMGSDVTIQFFDKEVPCHSYLLASRSPVFAKMLSEERKENEKIVLDKYSEKYKEQIFNMLKWIHTGEAEFNEDIFQVIDLLHIAKDFELTELVQHCEEDIKGKLSSENVLDLLVIFGNKMSSAVISEEIWNECKSLFLREFAYVQQLNPDLEDKISKVPGLMSQLFAHVANAKHPKKNRHVRFSVD